MDRQPSLNSVAKACGKSLATVSRVLSGSSYTVTEETRKIVLEAAERVGYVPNTVGRSLKSRQTRELGVAIPNLINPYYPQLLSGIQDVSLAENYQVLLCSAQRDPRTEADNIYTLLGRRVECILLASISADTTAAKLALRMNVPLIVMEQQIDVPSTHIGFDYAAGARMATEHLIRLGHRRVGFMGAPLTHYSRRKMLEGYADCMRDHGLPVAEDMIYLGRAENEVRNNFELENGRDCARHFLQSANRPTGFVCINDMTAIAAMQTFQNAGVRVPEDVSIVGFDNIPIAETMTPPLTTIDQSGYEMGVQAARAALRILKDGEQANQSIVLQPSIVVRASTRERPSGGIS